MRRIAIALAGIALLLGVFAPVVLAADPTPGTGRVLISTQGDVALPAGDQADVVIVVEGNADISGTVRTLIVVDGSANLSAARLDTVIAVRSQVEVGSGTVISGELQRWDSTVHQTGNVEIRGGITDISAAFFNVGAVLAPIFLLLWLGYGVATLVTALLAAGLAGRQLRETGRLISHEPVLTGLTGLLGIIVIPILAILSFITVIGVPLGLGILFMVLPFLAFAGYLVAATWAGDWILGRLDAGRQRERPYLAAVLGVILLGVLGLIPIINLAVAIASLFGFGAVIVMAFRTIRGTPRPVAPVQQPLAAPTGA